MSRLFNGSTDLLTYALPDTANPGPVNYTHGTLLIVARFVTASSWVSLIEMENADGTSVKGGIGRHAGGGLYTVDGATLRHTDEGGAGTFTIGTGDNWCLYAATKATGTVAPILYKIPLATLSRSTYVNPGTMVNTGLLANGRIKLGGNDDPANIRLAAAAILPGVVLTGPQLDGIASAKTTASILALAATNSWVVDDSDGFATNLYAANTPRTANATAPVLHTLPTSDGDNPASWVYGAGGGGGTAPSNTVAPVASGTGVVGQTLSSTTGTWTGDATITYGYQWQRGGSNISGATSSSYTLVTADGGTNVRCVVTGTNGTGSASANSNAIAIEAAPANTVAPAVTGTTTTGQTLTCSTGTWSNNPDSFTYQWKRAGANISGATSSTYVLQVADEGVLVRCDVTATNEAGSATAQSNAVTPSASGGGDPEPDLYLRWGDEWVAVDRTTRVGGTFI